MMQPTGNQLPFDQILAAAFQGSQPQGNISRLPAPMDQSNPMAPPGGMSPALLRLLTPMALASTGLSPQPPTSGGL